MSLDTRTRSTSPLHLRPLGAIAISLVTVLVVTALLGVVFLPHEIRQLTDDGNLQLVDRQFIDSGRCEVLLTKRMEGGMSGRVLCEVVLRDVRAAAPCRVLFPASQDPLVMAAASKGSRLFVGRLDGQILALDLQAAEPALALVGRYSPNELSNLCCTASGDVLVAGGPSGIRAWNTNEGRLIWTRDDLRYVCWALNTRSAELLVQSSEGRLLELDLATGRTLRVVGSSQRPATAMALSPDGARIAQIGWTGELEVIDRASGSPAWTDSLTTRRASCARRTMAFSPSGAELIAAHPTNQSCLQVWSACTGRHIRDLRGHAAPIAGLAFDPAGRLCTWAVDGSVCTWNSWHDDVAGSTHFAGQLVAGSRASAWRTIEPARGAACALSFPTRR